jgi:hypothetical protein
MKIKHLETCFKVAKESGSKYFAITVVMEGIPSEEIIINPTSNFDAKLEYYKRAYDEDLNHRHANGRITGFTYGDSFKEIESDLYGL